MGACSRGDGVGACIQGLMHILDLCLASFYVPVVELCYSLVGASNTKAGGQVCLGACSALGFIRFVATTKSVRCCMPRLVCAPWLE